MTRELHIVPVLNGFTVRVGCQTIVFRSPNELGDAVASYYKNPEEVEQRYLKGAVNNTMGEPLPAQPVGGPTTAYRNESIPEAQCDSPITVPPIPVNFRR